MVKISNVLKKFIVLLSLLFIIISCSQEENDVMNNKKIDNNIKSIEPSVNEKTVLEKSKLMLTSDVRENDTFIFNGQKYIISEMYTSKFNIGKIYKYNRLYVFKNGLEFDIHSDNPDNLSDYEIYISHSNSCRLSLNYFKNEFYFAWIYVNRKNISSAEATKLLLQLYTGKDWNDICKSYSKEIKL